MLDRTQGRIIAPPRFQRLGDIGPLPPRQQIISGLLAAGEIASLVGAPGCGKSAVAASMALAIARGCDFLGLLCTQGEVVFIAVEKGRLTLRRLIAAGGSDLPIVASTVALAVDDPVDIASAIEDITAVAHTPLLVVIDTLSRTFGGLDENSAKDMNLAFRQIDRIARAFPTAALVLVHHTSKDGSAARGSGAILANVDLELTVRAGRSGIRSMRITKANAIQEGRTFDFRLEEIEGLDGETEVLAAALDHAPGASLPTGQALQLLDLIPAGETSRRSLLLAARASGLLGAERNKQGERLRQLLHKLKEQGLIEYTDTSVTRSATPQNPSAPQ